MINFEKTIINTKDVVLLLNNNLGDLYDILRLNETKLMLSQSCTFIAEEHSSCYVSLDYLFNDFEMLQTLLTGIQKIYSIKMKKKENFHFSINLNSIEFIFRENKALDKRVSKSNINLTINFKNFNENDLLSSICQISCYSKLYMSIIEVIKLSQCYKKHTLNISFTNEGGNKEFRFHLDKLILGLNNYCQYNSYCVNITDYGQCISNKHTLIINNTIKHKEKKSYFIRFAKELQNTSLQAFSKYMDKIIEYVSEFIIDDSINNPTSFNVRHLIRNFRNNKIYVTNLYNGSLSFIIYINNLLFFDNILDLIRLLDNDNNFLMIKDFTFIFQKTFFDNFLARKDNLVNNILSYNFYIINDCLDEPTKVKKYEEDVKYDIYVLEKKVIIANYTKFIQSELGEGYGPTIYEFWKIFLFSSDIFDRLFSFNKKFISHYICLIIVDGVSIAFDITSNGIIVKRIYKEYESLLNSDIMSSINTIPLVSIISNIGGVLNIPTIYATLRQFAQWFLKHFTLYEDDENDIREEGIKFKPLTESLTTILHNQLYKFLDAKIFNMLYCNLFMSTYNLKYLIAYANFYKGYYSVTGCELSETVLFIENKTEDEILTTVRGLYNEFKFLNNFVIFNTTTVGRLESPDVEIKQEVQKALPFKNTEIISTIEKLENSYILVRRIDNFKNLPHELTALLKLITTNKSSFGRLNNPTILANLYEMFISRLQIYYYEGNSKLLNSITKELVYHKEAKFKEENLEEEFRPNLSAQLSKFEDLEIESNNSTTRVKEKKCLIY
jgi:hypothetical protein